MRRRDGFTLTELLVAFALIIFIMVILTEAFSAGLDSFRQLKSIGDMQEKMRSAVIILRRDLQAEHFDDPRGNRLSDQDLRGYPTRTTAPVSIPNPPNPPQNDPPDAGYFRLWQQNLRTNLYNTTPASTTWNSIVEGIDNTFIPTTRANTHLMAFTVRLRGAMPGDYFTTSLPGTNPLADSQMRTMCPTDFQTGSNTMYNQWAEVVYFLKPEAGRTAGTTPLYGLYRRQRLLGSESNSVTITANQFNNYSEVSFPPPTGNSVAENLLLNDPRRITEPQHRFMSQPGSRGGVYAGMPTLNQWTLKERLGLTDARAGDDLLLTSVISFDIKAIYQGFPQTGTGLAIDNPYFSDLPPLNYTGGNPASPYLNPAFAAAGNYCVFDTWSKYGNYSNWNSRGTNVSLPLQIRILALQVTIRVYDENTGLTRQTTLVQDM